MPGEIKTKFRLYCIKTSKLKAYVWDITEWFDNTDDAWDFFRLSMWCPQNWKNSQSCHAIWYLYRKYTDISE